MNTINPASLMTLALPEAAQTATPGENTDPTAFEKMMGLGNEKTLSPEEKWQAAKKFESFFVSFIFSQVQESMPESEALGGDQGKMFQSLFFQEMGNKLAKSSHNLGVADQIYRQMTGKTHKVE